jgi:hypothetical protein
MHYDRNPALYGQAFAHYHGAKPEMTKGVNLNFKNQQKIV